MLCFIALSDQTQPELIQSVSVYSAARTSLLTQYRCCKLCKWTKCCFIITRFHHNHTHTCVFVQGYWPISPWPQFYFMFYVFYWKDQKRAACHQAGRSSHLLISLGDGSHILLFPLFYFFAVHFFSSLVCSFSPEDQRPINKHTHTFTHTGLLCAINAEIPALHVFAVVEWKCQINLRFLITG